MVREGIERHTQEQDLDVCREVCRDRGIGSDGGDEWTEREHKGQALGTDPASVRLLVEAAFMPVQGSQTLLSRQGLRSRGMPQHICVLQQFRDSHPRKERKQHFQEVCEMG